MGEKYCVTKMFGRTIVMTSLATPEVWVVRFERGKGGEVVELRGEEEKGTSLWGSR